MALKNKKIPIDYTARDFESIRDSLVDHAKRYYSKTFQDFNEAGFGSLAIDTVAYVGDILSLYLDYQANENYIETAMEEENILKLGKQMGYKPLSPGLATGLVDIYIEIPALADGSPDTSFIPILKRGSSFSSIDGGHYRLNEDLNFNDENIDILTSKVDETSSFATHYVLRKSGEVISGILNTESIAINDFIEFRSIKVGDDIDDDIVDIIEVEDLEGNIYFEVDNLSQDIIYRSISNRDTTTNKLVPNIIKPIMVPRRFMVERSSAGEVFLRFGGGSESDSLNETISEPSDVALKTHGRDYISSTYFDPKILAYNDKLGIGPSNTILNVTYRFNDEDIANASVNAINNVVMPILEFHDETLLDSTKMDSVVNSVEVDNPEPIVGDIEAPTTEELRQRILSAFTTQNRAVTREDYIYLAYAMPGKFGSIKRANIIRDPDSQKRNLNMYIISEDSEGDLIQSSSALKNNLKIWLNKHRMVNDTIDILDTKTVHLGINFSVLTDDSVNKFDALSSAIEKLKLDLTIRKMEIGENFSIIEIYKSLKELDEVIDIIDVELVNKSGNPYSDIGFNIRDNLSSDGRILICPNNVIFEIKNPDSDIKGTVR
jgi:hypothetical protein